MNQEISKNLKCISLRNGAEIWLEADRLENLKSELLKSGNSKFVVIDEEVINTADIVGILSAETMEAVTRRKNGQWQCKFETWHKRGEECDCDVEPPEYYKRWLERKEKENKK